MKVRLLTTQIATLLVMVMATATSFAHEGMHASAQAHVGENHMGLMEVALATIAIVAFGAWALKEVKAKK